MAWFGRRRGSDAAGKAPEDGGDPNAVFDREMEQFRLQMTPPDRFEDGFSWSALFGALFVGALMVPGAIYMTLLAGQGIGPAAQWVTLILFIEVARRANKTLGKAEIYTLFYLAGTVMITANMAQGQFHGGLSVLYFQFMARSDALNAAGIAEKLPTQHWNSRPGFGDITTSNP